MKARQLLVAVAFCAATALWSSSVYSQTKDEKKPAGDKPAAAQPPAAKPADKPAGDKPAAPAAAKPGDKPAGDKGGGEGGRRDLLPSGVGVFNGLGELPDHPLFNLIDLGAEINIQQALQLFADYRFLTQAKYLRPAPSPYFIIDQRLRK